MLRLINVNATYRVTFHHSSVVTQTPLQVHVQYSLQ